MNYPNFWPRANPARPEALQSRITEAQKKALYNREVTTRDLARELGVHEKYLSSKFYTKVEIVDKRPLIDARKAFKLAMAVRVLKGELSMQQAADSAFVSYNTMQRFTQKAKEAHPELVAPYAVIVTEQRKLAIRHARQVRKSEEGTGGAS